ncbi:hypothetical protein ACHAQK_009198 [Fusarium lateritium]
MGSNDDSHLAAMGLLVPSPEPLGSPARPQLRSPSGKRFCTGPKLFRSTRCSILFPLPDTRPTTRGERWKSGGSRLLGVNIANHHEAIATDLSVVLSRPPTKPFSVMRMHTVSFVVSNLQSHSFTIIGDWVYRLLPPSISHLATVVESYSPADPVGQQSCKSTTKHYDLNLSYLSMRYLTIDRGTEHLR